MPVVTIQALRPLDPARIDRLFQEVPSALAAALACAESEVWVYWQPVEAASVGPDRRPYAGHCPVVTIRARAWRPDAHVRSGMEAAAKAVSSALGLPLEDTWVHWLEIPAGRVFSGGQVG